MQFINTSKVPALSLRFRNAIMALDRHAVILFNFFTHSI